MRHRFFITSLIFCFALGIPSTQAQFLKKMQQKLQDKVDKKVDDTMNGNKDTKNTDGNNSTSAKLPHIEEVYSFTPGNTVIFSDNFSTETSGRMPKHWKSSGGGSINTVSDIPGKWLALAPKTTYRINNLLPMPGNFTVEFDIVTRSMAAKDIGAMLFGFGSDNSNREYVTDAYNENAITATQLHFWNKEVTNSSSATKINNPLSFPLNNYANGLLHVAIAVEGENMRVYINKSKLVDTRMFNKDTLKYFYISAPYSYDADAMVYFSNFVIAK
ncbi:hypothetical protein [Pedobacter sp. L105]|uniref:hypothetical protein n=1 Tax=Pedobacter sp. L105 TaxID=1641871 RepID=UPI0020B1428C|nr:hypothetical protein [Pedobacter sp. L105]